MRNRAREVLNAWRKIFLTAAGVVALAGPIVLGLMSASQVRAQSTQTTLSFEVASIKPDHSDSRMTRLGGPDASRFAATNATAIMLIEFAYNMKDSQISGQPGWTASDKFDIDAKVEDSVAEQLQKLPRTQQLDQMRLMVQSLLADRFGLKVTHNTKELSEYALVVAKNGPKLKEVAPPDAQANSAPPTPGNPMVPPPGGFLMTMGPGGEANVTAKAAPITNLINLLSRQLGREIVDRTGLKGTYDISLRWTSDTGLGGGPLPSGTQGPDTGPPPDSSGTSIFTAIQEQLGLKLESTKGPVDTIVIDHIEEPSAN